MCGDHRSRRARCGMYHPGRWGTRAAAARLDPGSPVRRVRGRPRSNGSSDLRHDGFRGHACDLTSDGRRAGVPGGGDGPDDVLVCRSCGRGSEPDECGRLPAGRLRTRAGGDVGARRRLAARRQDRSTGRAQGGLGRVARRRARVGQLPPLVAGLRRDVARSRRRRRRRGRLGAGRGSRAAGSTRITSRWSVTPPVRTSCRSSALIRRC